MADEQVRIDIVADDKASKPIDAVAKKVDALESEKVDIPIGADTDAAERDITGLLKKVDGLARDPANVLLATNAAKIAGDIHDLIADLDKLDANDPHVEVKTDQINKLQGELDQVETKLRDINGTPVDVDTRKATKGMDDLAKSADSSKSVMANMVGNTAQDLGALGGIAGSAGVAFGQMGEYMADAQAAGDDLGTTMKNFGKVAIPVAALAFVTELASAFSEAAAAEKKLNTEKVDDYADAIKRGSTAFRAFTDQVRETQKIMYTADKGGGLLGLFSSTQDLTPILRDAGLSVEQYFEIVARFPEHGSHWISTLEKIGVAEGDAIAITRAAGEEYENQAKAVDHAADKAEVFGQKITTQRDAVLQATIAQRDHVDALDAAADAADQAARDTAQLEGATRRAELAASQLDDQWNILDGTLSNDQGIATVQAGFDTMREKGKEAWEAAKKGATDAEAKSNDYAQSVRDAKGDVVNLGKQIGLSIPEVKNLLLKIDDGQIDDVERQLNILTRNRTMELSIIARGGDAIAKATTGTGGGGGPRAVPMTVVNVTQHLPRGWRGNALAEAQASARRSGGLYRRVRR